MTLPTGQLTVTRSVCPDCGTLVSTKVLARDGRVFFEKHCPVHGVREAEVSDDLASYLDADRFHRVATTPLAFNKPWKKGCPDDCGFCPQHEQHVCMPIVEITDYCDMTCPICLVQNRNSWHMSLDQLRGILDRLIETEEAIDVLNVSGGEPTMHPEFEAIIDEILSRREILRVSVSTNGRRLMRDDHLRRFLAERNVVISLQFDGTDSAALSTMRGISDGAERLALIDEMGRIDGPCSLTLTLVNGLNEAGLDTAVDMLFTRDHVLSLMVQPATFCGNAAGFSTTHKRLTSIPAAIRLIEQASRGRVVSNDFSPLPCSHPNCFSLSFFLRAEDNSFISIKRMFEPETYLDIIKNRALFGTDPENFGKIEAAVYDLWSGPSALTPDSEKALRSVRRLLKDVQNPPQRKQHVENATHHKEENGSTKVASATRAFDGCRQSCFDAHHNLQVAQRNIKSIFLHAFMDADTFDITRVRKCCQVYPLRDGRFMPACVYNVLHRGKS
ncbi:MAG: radical SAM protein [Candidatus Riflebacteria bacterium]|nr:radical SAM protein [Candidatus Riflebacteria bacterium]